MVFIDGGKYIPFAKIKGHGGETEVEPFFMDLRPVTNRDYLDFVMANPEWRRSRVTRIFADGNYLRNWSGDLAPGPGAPPDAPVVFVSWYAARAYCSWRGKSLPTLTEWDFAARRARGGESNEAILKKQLDSWYGRRAARNGPAGVDKRANTPESMDGTRLWEWVEDYSSILLDGGSGGSSAMNSCGGASAGFTDLTDYAAFLRYAFLSGLKPDYCLPNLGFRCAIEVNKIKEVPK